MRSPFDADNLPPLEPPAKLDRDVAPYWSIVAEQWETDDEVRDRILVGMLARADQSTVVPVVRERLVVEAELVLADHRADEAGNCCLCTARSDGRCDIPYPCWGVRLARLVLPDADVAQSERRP
ncbi:MAG: hypothetical protein ACRDT6_12630 [Micromonosporaceae bacterium]